MLEITKLEINSEDKDMPLCGDRIRTRVPQTGGQDANQITTDLFLKYKTKISPLVVRYHDSNGCQKNRQDLRIKTFNEN